MTGDPPTPFPGGALRVALGGVAGATARWAIVATVAAGADFPWPTLLVNVVGCFVVGMLARAGRTTVLLVGLGFAGGLTTFSTFSVELAGLVRDGEGPLALSYGAASLVLGTAAVVAGRHLAPEHRTT